MDSPAARGYGNILRMPDPALLPSGATVDAVDWVRSGTRSGLVRVRGRRAEDVAFELPDLVLDDRRFSSLPDPRADRDRSGWRGAYVVDAAVAAAAGSWRLQWPGVAPVPIQRPEIPGTDALQAPPPEPE